ncbi:hypothetical protein BJ138DRAFT_1142421 [Hygrophoropsis aurantiaca]|uniref:Uncharacterized protein n=1 Tax=Hygrophoropsis aurantiaca TaxID=72124 RepID=A0ACB8ANM3_9AGAM|nr:hypothetical protein BJ138DRAFT_1142421 [Hygrophoropsis aurantiaca]
MRRVSALSIALFALVLSLGLNALTMYRLRAERMTAEPRIIEDDSQYSYIGDDHPTRLPLYLPHIALEIEDTKRYGISNPQAWSEWRNTDLFPNGNGFVKLGEQGRSFGVSMFHQMHCMQMIRKAIIHPDTASTHTHHCLNLIRQAILCASDTTLDPINVETDGTLKGTDGIGVVHVCRDWEKVYDFVRENHKRSEWNKTGSTT